jgi:Mrp family chromosome partitioning ATPase/capsular polysaccharide biosynthesis protein
MPQAEEPARSPLREAARVISDRRWLFLSVALIVPALVLAWSLTRDDEYNAYAEVLVSRATPASLLTGAEDPLAYAEEDRLTATQAAIANNPEVTDDAVRRAGVTDITGNELLATGSVSPERSTDVLIFSVDESSKERAQLLANGWAHAFSDYRSKLDAGAIVQARQSVERRLRNLQERGLGESALAQSLNQKAQDLATLRLLQTTSAQVVREARAAEKTGPTPVTHGLMAAIAGLFLALLVVFARDALDTRVRRVQDVTDLLGVRVLGRMPPFRTSKRAPVYRDDANDALSEGIRTVRGNLTSALGHLDQPAVLFTSAQRRAGKSTLVAGLAVAAARTGLNVVVLDLDLREPEQERLLGVDSPEHSLPDVLRGDVGLPEALVLVPDTTDHGGSVRLLCPGGRAAAPADVLNHRRFREAVFSPAREAADMVFIDAAALLSASDAVALTGWVDTAVIVARLNQVKRDDLRELRATLESSATPIAGVVVTAAAVARPPSVPPSERTSYQTNGTGERVREDVEV